MLWPMLLLDVPGLAALPSSQLVVVVTISPATIPAVRVSLFVKHASTITLKDLQLLSVSATIDAIYNQ